MIVKVIHPNSVLVTCKILRRTCKTWTKRRFLDHVDLRGRRHFEGLTSSETDLKERMADRAEIQQQIKEQGELVRQLKAAKAEQEKVLFFLC